MRCVVLESDDRYAPIRSDLSRVHLGSDIVGRTAVWAVNRFRSRFLQGRIATFLHPTGVYPASALLCLLLLEGQEPCAIIANGSGLLLPVFELASPRCPIFKAAYRTNL